MGKNIAIHCNGSLKHQVEAARCLKAGFIRHGIVPSIVTVPMCNADIHVCMGPWFALKQNIGNRVLYLDRAFWGDPTSVSLQWLNVDGSKAYQWGQTGRRPHPELKPQRETLTSAVVLCDYNDSGERDRLLAIPHFESVAVRRHPSNQAQAQTLKQCLGSHDVAIGRHSTAMVQAAIDGLAVVSRIHGGAVSPIAGRCMNDIAHRDRVRWINDLAFHNWGLDEIESGEAWSHLYQ